MHNTRITGMACVPICDLTNRIHLIQTSCSHQIIINSIKFLQFTPLYQLSFYFLCKLRGWILSFDSRMFFLSLKIRMPQYGPCVNLNVACVMCVRKNVVENTNIHTCNMDNKILFTFFGLVIRKCSWNHDLQSYENFAERIFFGVMAIER